MLKKKKFEIPHYVHVHGCKKREGKCIHNIFRKTYISDANGGCDHINYINIIKCGWERSKKMYTNTFGIVWLDLRKRKKNIELRKKERSFKGKVF